MRLPLRDGLRWVAVRMATAICWTTFERVIGRAPRTIGVDRVAAAAIALFQCFDGEARETGADIPPGTTAADNESYMALGHHRRVRDLLDNSTGCPTVVSAQHLIDIGDFVESAVSVPELVFADTAVTAPGGKADAHSLAIGTSDYAGTGSGLAETRCTF